MSSDAKASAIGLINSHLAAQGAQAPRPLVARAGQFHNQIGAEGREAAAFLWSEACQRSRRITEASGLNTEPSGKRKPLELPHTFQPPC